MQRLQIIMDLPSSNGVTSLFPNKAGPATKDCKMNNQLSACRSLDGMERLASDLKQQNGVIKTKKTDDEIMTLRRQNSANSLRCLAMACTPNRRGKGSTDLQRRRQSSAKNIAPAPVGRKVLAGSTHSRRRLLQDTTKSASTPVPSTVRLNRSQSCRGRLGSDEPPSAIQRVPSAQSLHQDSNDDSDDDDSSCCSDSGDSDSGSECSSSTFGSEEDFDLERMEDMLSHERRSSRQPMRWRKDDGTVITEATPDEVQRLLIAGGRNRPPPANYYYYPPVVPQRPWVCLCQQENEFDYSFCGMCGTPKLWECVSCLFPRNKCRNPYCGGCGLRRKESNPAA